MWAPPLEFGEVVSAGGLACCSLRELDWVCPSLILLSWETCPLPSIDVANTPCLRRGCLAVQSVELEDPIFPWDSSDGRH